jgi:hypothetical protein
MAAASHLEHADSPLGSAVQLREISHFQDTIGPSPEFNFEMGMGGRDGHCAYPVPDTQFERFSYVHIRAKPQSIAPSAPEAHQ